MTRSELLKTPKYWTASTQMYLCHYAKKFMEKNNMNSTQLAKYLGISKESVSQLLNEDYNGKLSEMVELSLALGYVPNVQFEEIDMYIAND